MQEKLETIALPSMPLGAGPWPVVSGDFKDWRIASRWPMEAIHAAKEERPLQLLPAHLRYAHAVAETHDSRISVYAAMKGRFEEAIGTLPEERRDALRDTLEALRFIDNRDVLAAAFLRCLTKGASIETLGIQYLYNEMRDPDDPTFENIKNVARFLKTTRLQPGVKKLKAVHVRAMAGGVEGISEEEQGALRTVPVIGDESHRGITPRQLKVISTNPYTSFSEMKAEGGKHFGSIVYPEPETVKQEALERIQGSHPLVYSRVMKVQERGWRGEDQGALTQALVEALLEERFNTFNEDVAALGAFDSREKVVAYVKAVALLYRDIVSIHPFVNGNGRSLRLDIFSLLDKVGISRPRLNDPDADLLSPPSHWVREVFKGILNTDQMYRDIEQRVRFGLSIQNSSAVFFPDRPADVGLHLRNNKKRLAAENVGLFPVDDGQYMAYVAARLQLEAQLKREFTRDPLAVLKVIREEYKEFAKSTQYFFTGRKDETRLARVELADRDFVESFGCAFARDADRWNYKVKRWYRPEFIWRGLSGQDHVMSDDEAVSIFTHFSVYTVSQRMLEEWRPGRSQKTLASAARSELQRFNEDLVTGSLWSLLRDHVNAEGRYPESYALSTSLQWTIARAFGMGALVIDNNMRDYWNRQDQLSSRIVVGAYRAHKDVEINTFKGVDSRFSARSGRQHEVAAIGGIDPDAVMLVQSINAKGKIEKSFIRNPLLPSEIWVIDGGYHPDDGPLSDLPKEYVMKKLSLRVKA